LLELLVLGPRLEKQSADPDSKPGHEHEIKGGNEAAWIHNSAL
jgi:hypothetical protein